MHRNIELVLPEGNNGIRVSNVLQLSNHPCKHKTGGLIESPKTLPAMTPHGTGICISLVIPKKSAMLNVLSH